MRQSPLFSGGPEGALPPVLCAVLKGGSRSVSEHERARRSQPGNTHTPAHVWGKGAHEGQSSTYPLPKEINPPFPSSTPTTFLLHGWQMRTGDGWHHCPCGSLMGPGEEGSIFSVFLCLHSLHPSEQFCLPSPAHAQACTCRVLHAEPGFTRTRHWRTPGRPAGLSLATCLGATTHGWLLFLPRSPQQEPGCAWPAPYHCHLGRAPLTAI